MGIIFQARANNADVYDDFERPDSNLSGSATSISNATWGVSRFTGATTVPVVKSGQLKAGGSGTSGNALALFDAGNPNIIVVATLGDLATSPVTTIAFRIKDTSSYYYLALRQSSSVTYYGLYFRYTEADSSSIATTNVVPMSGDKIRIDAIGGSVVVRVNGKIIISTALVNNLDETHVGAMVNAADTTTGLRDFGYYLR